TAQIRPPVDRGEAGPGADRTDGRLDQRQHVFDPGSGRGTEADGAPDHHGFTTAHWVTGAKLCQPTMPPIGRARATAMRTRSPPRRWCHWASVASPATVTTLATRR